MDYLVQVFKALGNERKLKIIGLLLEKGEFSLVKISPFLKIPETTYRRNLKILEKTYLVKSKIKGGEAHYSFNQPSEHPYNTPLSKLIKLRQKRRIE